MNASEGAEDTVRDAADVLRRYARSLAERHRQTRRHSPWGRDPSRTLHPRFARSLEAAQRHLAAGSDGARSGKAAEWFLDNYYLIRRVARQVEEELPIAFLRRLPNLASGANEGRPRVFVLAQGLIETSALTLNLSAIRHFIDAYQEVLPLTIAELWALPTMLRAAVLSHLVHFLSGIHALVDETEPRTSDAARSLEEPHKAPLDLEATDLELEATDGVERAIRALRVLDMVDWKVFFEKTSRVEFILRQDPAGVYARMDFETCDAYRKSVEDVSWATGRSEDSVAELAVDLARGAPGEARRGHVGYYLVAEGRSALEAATKYRRRGMDRVRRFVLKYPTASYLLPLALLTALLALAVAAFAWTSASNVWIPVAFALAWVPASTVAVAALRSAFARLLSPRTLPKLNLSEGLSPEHRTLVAMPTLLGRPEDVTGMVRQLELHYLSNPDPELRFALLTDMTDGKSLAEIATRADLLESASEQITLLNAKYGHEGAGPFHLLHREPRWNAAEGCFMGWERKRGKLEELNRLLRGDEHTSFCIHVGERDGLSGVQFVITLDSDTELPLGAAQQLIGVLAHPLNQAVVDRDTRQVTAGYTIIQPRIEMSPSSSARTAFAHIFGCSTGFDIYTHACSELYQDLFGTGLYVGKGIYDVDAFMASVEGCAPENSLVSHDLFEGILGRTGLATDVVLFESFPSSYVTYAMRMHRWARGDWQLAPWLLPDGVWGKGERVAIPALIDRWKIVDNLRRTLATPFLLLLFALGWLGLPGPPLVWTLLALALLVLPVAPGIVSSPGQRLVHLGRTGLALAFLAYEATLSADAIVRTLARIVITRKHRLQWVSATHAAFQVAAQSQRRLFWRTMVASPATALVLTLLVFWTRSSALVFAGPLLLAWFFAPEIALRVSRPRRSRSETVSEADRHNLRLLARRTWRFFDAFVGPNDQWLPIDNYQDKPHEQTAHRTSPTNIGLALLATLSAYDLGYIGPSELSLRVRRTMETVKRLEHHHGHLFNWYDTKNLEPLLPRYVSTVDSGNLAGCLIALSRGCLDVVSSPVVRAEAWEGLRDSIDLFAEVVNSAPDGGLDSLKTIITRMSQAATYAGTHLEDTYATLLSLCVDSSAELDRELLALLEKGTYRYEADLLSSLRTATERLRQQLQQMRREVDGLLPWLALGAEAAAHAICLPVLLRLDQIPDEARRLRREIEEAQARRRDSQGGSTSLDDAAVRLAAVFKTAEVNASLLIGDFTDLASKADAEMAGMDFKLLYDGARKLLHIGYNATVDQLDAHYYDLLASEARLASYLAIVKRDIPESHWFALGRPMTKIAGVPGLLSWGGTMFEYLMPSLLMRSRPGTLLAQTEEVVIDAQMAYGRRRHEPWGVSESAYARLDAGQTYQYRAFGVPGLGFKRGIEDDRVVTPYASMLAASRRPRAVAANATALYAASMLGTFGFFEALDSSPNAHAGHAQGGQSPIVVRSYMAHHQGMILIALGNLLSRRSMVDRFHSDARVESAEFLLSEHAPQVAPAEWPISEGSTSPAAAKTLRLPPAPGPWSVGEEPKPQAFVLSNGHLTSLVTASGAGGLRWHGLALTRYVPDATHDEDGIWIYVRDEASRALFRAASPDGRVTYAVHKAECNVRAEGISVHVDVAVAAADDAEIRVVTLRNETDQPRVLSVTSAGRPLLLDAAQASTHPVFSSMFVESEWLAEIDGLLFARRPQKLDEEPAVLVHRLVREGTSVSFIRYESERGAFCGRGRSMTAPAALAADHGEDGDSGLRGSVGPVLDPVMSLMARVSLEPMGVATMAFVTTVARARSSALEIARKYGSMHAVRWALRDAEQEAPRRLARTQLEPRLVPTVQRFLSALLFGDAGLRALASVRAAAPPCQRRLWGRGISGDDPIVLIQVDDPSSALLPEVLAAQRFLRSCGVRMDLVLVDGQVSGYVTAGAETVRGALAENDALDWLDVHGGVFLVAADQVSKEEVLHLEAAARIVLHTTEGPLDAQLQRAGDSMPALPRFEASLPVDAAPIARARVKALFDNGTGGFTEDGREYVLEVRPGAPTPAPWCNVLANAKFGCLVSESSLGSTWSLNSGENRLTPWRNDPLFDSPSEALYLRDEETAAVWSTTPLPAGQDAPTLVRHGAGYTTYERHSHGLIQEMTVFVPPDSELKVVRLRLKNTLERHRRLTATYYAEWVLGSQRPKQRPYIVSEFSPDSHCLLATCDWNEEFAGRVAFLASHTKVHSFTADRTEFLGHRGDYARPEALERWGLSGRVDVGVDPCGALQVHLDLEPGEQLETHFILGEAASREEALTAVTRFREASAVLAARDELRTYWDGILDQVQVKTPEPAMDLLLNRWLLYQTLSSRIFGRTAFYQSSGAFGFRDQLQDVLALLHVAPGIARAHILEASRHQFEEGDVLHWWHPPSGRGVRTRCSDDMAWLAYVTGEYVVATGDLGILDEATPFLAGDILAPGEHERYATYATSETSASLYEHCRRSLSRALTKGAHGLPLMGDGDWNDGMNRVGSEGRGESVWLAWFLSAAMDRFASLAVQRGDPSEAESWRARADALRTVTKNVAWDGAWYLRAFHDDGSTVGSAASRECRIDSIAQSWAVLAEDAKVEHDPHAHAAVLAADDQLVREPDRLALLFWPPFDGPLHDPGYVRAYPPGIRENGGQYTHGATWLGFAYAALGEGARAERVFRLLNPILRTEKAKDSERYRVEPYVVAGDIYSCPPWTGRGGWTWYTGAAAWMWRLGVESVLGIRRKGGSLSIDPCIPPEWSGYEAWIREGGKRLHVLVENPARVSRGVLSITVDGKPIPSDELRLPPGVEGAHEVVVRLGPPEANAPPAGLSTRTSRTQVALSTT